MNALQNLHQHSTFCDGKNTPEEVVLAAMEKGFGGIGFSSHCYMPYADYCMTPESTIAYKQEINRLKEKYGDRIDVFLGLEFDLSNPEKPEGYDYLIGSIHGLRLDGFDCEFDGPVQCFEAMINRYFNGDGMAFAKEYYRQLAWLPDFAPVDIIGHFDLCTKHRDSVAFFDHEAKAYRNAAIEAAEALAGRVPLFEVNTGAIAKGLRTTPYPDPFIIKEMKRLGFGVVISSDCHQVHLMDCWFKEAAELLKSCGYKEKHIFTKDGFIPVPL